MVLKDLREKFHGYDGKVSSFFHKDVNGVKKLKWGRTIAVWIVIFILASVVASTIFDGFNNAGSDDMSVDLDDDGDPNAIAGVTFTTPKGYTLNSSEDNIYFLKGDDEISVHEITVNDSAKEYVASNYYTHETLEIGSIIFYVGSGWTATLDDIPEDWDYSNGMPPNAVVYHAYIFDYEGKVFEIKIPDNIDNHKALLKEILGI